MKFASYFTKSDDDIYADYSYFKMARFDIPDFVTPAKRYYDTYLFAPTKLYQPENWLPFNHWWKGKMEARILIRNFSLIMNGSEMVQLVQKLRLGILCYIKKCLEEI